MLFDFLHVLCYHLIYIYGMGGVGVVVQPNLPRSVTFPHFQNNKGIG